MNRLSRGSRRTAGVAAGTAVLLGTFLASAPGAMASIKPTPANTVAAALGANNIPAALVVLVDISASMAPPTGAYSEVYQQLPQFLTALHKQDPEDQVSVVEFADKADTHLVYNWGAPQDFHPEQNPNFTVGTDIGFAFQTALDQFASAPKNAQVDDVLLLSDGGMWAPDDAQYDGGAGYQAPGWGQLRQRVQGQPITGYGLPLTGDPALVSDLGSALTNGFGTQSSMLSANYSNLTSEMDAAQQKILDTRVATAAAQDSGASVQVAWSGSSVTSDTVQLHPAAGSADLTLKLTTTTSHVPLDVQNLHVSVSGFPEPITGQAAGDILVPPGHHPVTVPLHLSWKPIGNAQQTYSGTITLTATVGSPYYDAIRNYYQDRSFTVGGLAGGDTEYYQAAPPPPFNTLELLLIIVLVLFLLAVAYGLLLLRTRLSGTLTFRPPSSPLQTVELPRFWPWYTFDTSKLGVHQGTISVRRSVKTREMRLTSSMHRKVPVVLKDNGSTTIAGIRVQHAAGPQREFAGR